MNVLSFSLDVKEELSRSRIEGRSAKMALLSGLIKGVGRVSIAGGITVRVVSEAAVVAKTAHVLIREVFGLQTQLTYDESSPFSKKNIYEIKARMAEQALISMGLIAKNADSDIRDDVEDIPQEFRGEGFNYYLRGIFLGTGSITNPQKGYHLELVLKSSVFAKNLKNLINSNYNLRAKKIRRKNDWVVYIKESEKIAEFLIVVGAVTSLLEYENVRAQKETRNNVNRAVNCDAANISRTADAAFRQVEAIKYLVRTGELENMGKKYSEIASLRLKNPVSPLSELSELMESPISKSGVNHRLRKIVERARKLNEKNNN